MLHTVAVSGYRSLKDIVLCLGQLNLITGPNGSGKSNIYRALRLLASLADGRLIESLAKEGGLQSTLWAGPERFSAAELEGKALPRGKVRRNPVALQIGFSSDEFSYTIELGLPILSRSAFGLDPVIKRECLWRSNDRSARNMCADRRGMNLRIRPEGKWLDVDLPFTPRSSMLTEFADPVQSPELILTRDMIREWRFYDQFRTDTDSPSRRVEIGTFTPVLPNDGVGLAAALQTIREIGDADALDRAIDDAFPGSALRIDTREDGRFEIVLEQTGILRPLRAAELSDGTMRYLFLCAALLSPRPSELMILNEPETSLHPELLPALARLILSFASSNQMIIVSHSKPLIDQFSTFNQCARFELEKVLGMTALSGVNPLEIPHWEWPAR